MIKDKLLKIIFSSSVYLKEHKSQAKKLLKGLEDHSFQKQNFSDEFPWKVVIPAALVLITFILGIIIYQKKKNMPKEKFGNMVKKSWMVLELS